MDFKNKMNRENHLRSHVKCCKIYAQDEDVRHICIKTQLIKCMNNAFHFREDLRHLYVNLMAQLKKEDLIFQMKLQKSCTCISFIDLMFFDFYFDCPGITCYAFSKKNCVPQLFLIFGGLCNHPLLYKR